MRPRHLLATAALLLTGALAHADTISTFDLTGFAFLQGTTVSGQVSIDTTTGLPVTGNVTALFNGTTYILPVVTSIDGDYPAIRVSEPSGSAGLILVFPVSLVGYTGGPVCTLFGTTCPIPNENGLITGGNFYTETAVDIETQGSLQLESSITTTPEPASFALLATGLFSSAGLARRRT